MPVSTPSPFDIPYKPRSIYLRFRGRLWCIFWWIRLIGNALTISVVFFFKLQRHVSFKGDQESHLNDLILASQKKQVDDVVLKERALVPFFDAPVDAGTLQPLQGKAAHKKLPQQQQVMTNNKPRKANAKPASGSPKAVAVEDAFPAAAKQPKKGKKAAATKQQTTSEGQHQHQGRKHNRDPSYRHLPSLASAASLGPSVSSSGRQSPPRKRQEQHFYDSVSSAEQFANQHQPHQHRQSMVPKFAGPAFTNSPMPDTLPIPTTSLLLMHEAADRMAAGLML